MDARHWRLVGCKTRDGGDLDLTELQLVGPAGRVDVGAVLTSTLAPIAGNVADLADGGLISAVRFAASAVSSSGFALVWDLGADGDANGFKLAGPVAGNFLHGCTLQYSADAQVWVTLQSFDGIIFAGDGALSVVQTGDAYFDKVVSLLSLSGPHGSTAMPDAKSNVWTASGGAQISTAHWAAGAAAFSAGGVVSMPYAASQQLAANDFCIEFDLFPISLAYEGQVILGNWSTVAGKNSWLLGVSFPPFPSSRLTVAASPDGGYVAGNVRHFYGGGPDSELTLNQWQRVSWSRINGVFYLVLRGILLVNTSINGHLTSGNFSIYDGGEPLGLHPLGNTDAFHLKNLRITVGQGRYTSGYTPLSSPFPGTSVGFGAAPARFSNATVLETTPGLDRAVGAAGEHLREHPFCDAYHGGSGIIRSTVKQKDTPVNTPLRRRVDLIDERSRLTIRETWSDAATGNYEFRGIREGLVYSVAAWDHLHTYRAEIADHLTLANGGVELLP